HFDKDRYDIKPEFYAHLSILADKMVSCPDMMINATGMTDKDDNDKYNEQLSWNRVNAVIDYLNKNYGIDRNRFIVNFEGESNAEGTSKAAQYRERKVSLTQAGPNDKGSSNPAAPHPGIKAGQND
ncbi:MAG: OmpA family protein, partial [Bacteroidetes bacterium]|nr:OmpA family protein [Bacteroidota bacterium]